MFTKIKNEKFKEYAVSSIKDNPLIGDPTTNKEVFDSVAKNVLIPAFNTLIDELLDTNAPKHIGAEGGTLEELLNGLKKSLSDVPGTIDEKVATAIAQVVADAPEDLDTLKELSAWIKDHAGSAAEMNRTIEDNKEALKNKVDKDGDKVLSDNNYSNEEKEKVSTAYTHSQSTHAPSDAEKNTVVKIKRNGTALTPDANREVDIRVPTKMSELSNDTGYVSGGDTFVEIHIDTFDNEDPVIVTGGWDYISSEIEEDTGESPSGYVLNLIGQAGIDSPEEYPTVLIRGVGTPIKNDDAVNKVYADNLGKWKLIKSDTLSEDVGVLTVDLGEKYKELYIRMVVTTMNPDNTSGFPAGRVSMVVEPSAKQVFMEPSVVIGDTGTSYYLDYHIKLFDKYCRVHREYATTSKSYLAISVNNSLFSGYTDIGQKYIEAVTLNYLPAGTRVFPTGTYYEIWGVKA